MSGFILQVCQQHRGCLPAGQQLKLELSDTQSHTGSQPDIERLRPKLALSFVTIIPLLPST